MGGLSKVLFLECYGEPMNTKEFADIWGKTLEEVSTTRKKKVKREC